MPVDAGEVGRHGVSSIILGAVVGGARRFWVTRSYTLASYYLESTVVAIIRWSFHN